MIDSDQLSRLLKAYVSVEEYFCSFTGKLVCCDEYICYIEEEVRKVCVEYKIKFKNSETGIIGFRYEFPVYVLNLIIPQIECPKNITHLGGRVAFILRKR